MVGTKISAAWNFCSWPIMEMLKFHGNVDDDGRKVPIGNELSLIYGKDDE